MEQAIFLLAKELNAADRISISVFMVIFLLIGCGLIYWAHREKKKVEDMEEITATCIERVPYGSHTHSHRHGRSHGRTKSKSNIPTYICIFEYTYCGTTYTEMDAFNTGTNVGLPDVNEECSVRIDPEHPEMPYYLNRTSHLTQVVIGVLIIIASLVGLIAYNI